MEFPLQRSATGDIDLIVASTRIGSAELDHRRRSTVQRQSVGEVRDARRITRSQGTKHLDRSRQRAAACQRGSRRHHQRAHVHETYISRQLSRIVATTIEQVILRRLLQNFSSLRHPGLRQTRRTQDGLRLQVRVLRRGKRERCIPCKWIISQRVRDENALHEAAISLVLQD